MITNIVKIISIVSLINLASSQLLHSLVGLVTETTFQLKARSVDGLQISLQLNGLQLTPLDYSSQYNGYYYSLSYSGLTPATNYTLDVWYGGSQYTNQTKTFTTPNYGNAGSEIYFGVTSNQKGTGEREVFSKMSTKYPNFVMFLGNIDEYPSNIDKDETEYYYDLQDNYKQGK